jgi:hypothetical protein
VPQHDLEPLLRVIAAARAEQIAPPPEGQETKPYVPIEQYFDQAGWQELFVTVRGVRRHRIDLYNVFLGERRLAMAIVDELTDASPDTTFADLVGRLEKRAMGFGPWLVATPLANVEMSSAFVALDGKRALVRPEQAHDWKPGLAGDEATFELMRHLGDPMASHPRWLTHMKPHPIDSRHGAVLVSVEDGTAAAALATARTRAHYAVAVWALVRDPGFRRVWPTLGLWGPQPWIDHGHAYKGYVPGGNDEMRRARFIEHREFPLPEGDDLVLPFAVMGAVDEHRCAQALLSAAWALFQAIRWPDDVETTDRVLFLFTAIATLCEEPGRFSVAAVVNRWRALRMYYGIWDELAEEGYAREDLDEAERRLTDIRNIAAHGSDAALVNLGYPAGRTRTFMGKRQRRGHELALAVLFSELQPMQWAVRQVLCRLTRELAAAGFNDDLFERRMSGSTP